MDLETFSAFSMTELCKKLAHSTLFIDDKMTNYLQLHGGLTKLMSVGSCEHILQLTEAQRSFTPKVSFLISDLLTDNRTREIVHSVAENSKNILNHCIVIFSALPRHHDSPNNSESLHALKSLEQDMRLWLGGTNCVVEVLHIPLFLVSLTPDLFLCPSFATSLIPQLDNEDFHSDIDYLPDGVKIDIDIFLHCLNSLFASFNAKEEVFCVGPTSSIIGQRLVHSESSIKRHQSASNSVSLILIDRNADLITPFVAGAYSAFDESLQYCSSLEHCFCEKSIKQPNDAYPPFTLLENFRDPEANDLLQQMFEKSTDVMAGQCAEKIRQCIKRQFPSHDISNVNSLVELTEIYWKLVDKSGDANLFHSPCFQVISFIANIRRADENNNSVKIVQQLEMLVNLYDDFLSDFVQFSAENKFDWLMDLLCLALLYSISGAKSIKSCEDDAKSYLISKLAKDWSKTKSASSLDVIPFVDGLFVRLKNIARLRQVLGEQSVTKPYVATLIERVFDPKRPALAELSYKSAGFRQSLKQSLNSLWSLPGKLGGVDPRPDDSKIIILFILGGVTGYEVASIRKTLKNMHVDPKHHKLLIGSTHFVSYKDIELQLSKARSKDEE